jgi:acyl CoA:acetate/3-ketoacid CoA transferase beta subunit
MFGNINTHLIGDSYLKPKSRLTGSGGNNDLASLAESIVLVGLQSPDKFPAKVDFITSVGHLTGGKSRQEAGLLGNGPIAVVTNAGVYDFEPVSKRMRVKTLHPGVSFDLAQMCTGFDLLKPEVEIDVPLTNLPTMDIIEILRTQVDPHGVFTSIPGL